MQGHFPDIKKNEGEDWGELDSGHQLLKDVSWLVSVMEWMNKGAGGGDALGFCCLCRLSEFWLRKASNSPHFV